MQIREHGRIRQKHLRQPYYYSRWYKCRHGDCRTTLVMPEEFKVWNGDQESDQARRLQAIREQLKPRF
jgi:hypothetical protein